MLPSDGVCLCVEHVRYDWLQAERAIAGCQPEMVEDPIGAAARALGVLQELSL